MGFRTTFGLDASEATVARAMLEGLGHEDGEDVESFGVDLLPEELALMQERSRFQTEQGPLILAAAKSRFGEDFGGFHFDPQTGGAVVPVATSPTADDIAFVRSPADGKGDVVVRQVPFSETELQAVFMVLEADGSKLGLLSLGIDPVLNKLHVGVADPAALDVSAYGIPEGMLNVVAEEPVREISAYDTSYTTGRGGTRIGVYNSSGGSGELCTSGFAGFYNGTAGVFTAGHCINFAGNGGGQADLWQQPLGWSGAARRINNGGYYKLVDTYADVAFIKGSWGSSSSANCIVSAGSSCYSRIYGVGTSGGYHDTVGQTVCVALSVSERYTCPTIIGTNITVWNPQTGLTHKKVRKAALSWGSATWGDSGAPVKYSSTALGMVFGLSGSNVFYTHAYYMTSYIYYLTRYQINMTIRTY